MRALLRISLCLVTVTILLLVLYLINTPYADAQAGGMYKRMSPDGKYQIYNIYATPEQEREGYPSMWRITRFMDTEETTMAYIAMPRDMNYTGDIWHCGGGIENKKHTTEACAQYCWTTLNEDCIDLPPGWLQRFRYKVMFELFHLRNEHPSAIQK